VAPELASAASWDGPTVQVEKASHWYGKGALRKQILFDVSTAIEPGEVVILTGPSGSGKTTLLTLMGALRAGQEGSLRIFGQELRGASEATLVGIRRRIGYIFQSHNLLPALDVEQNVQMALQLQPRSERAGRAEERERIVGVLERVGLGDHVTKRIDQLSGGQRQRVAIARALINKPRVILADEPTASLDKESGRDVADLIQELAREEGASVVLVTHDNRILDIADRILHLEDGRVRALTDAVAQEASDRLELIRTRDPGGFRMLSTLSRALARVAAADRSIDEAEIETIRDVLGRMTDLAEGEIELVLGLAVDSTAAKQGLPRERLGEREKAQVVAALHAVAEADGDFCDRERAEIDALIEELGIAPAAR